MSNHDPYNCSLLAASKKTPPLLWQGGIWGAIRMAEIRFYRPAKNFTEDVAQSNNGAQ